MYGSLSESRESIPALSGFVGYKRRWSKDLGLSPRRRVRGDQDRTVVS